MAISSHHHQLLLSTKQEERTALVVLLVLGPTELFQAKSVIPDLGELVTFSFVIHVAKVHIIRGHGFVCRFNRATGTSMSRMKGCKKDGHLGCVIPTFGMDFGLEYGQGPTGQTDHPLVVSLDGFHFRQSVSLTFQGSIGDDEVLDFFKVAASIANVNDFFGVGIQLFRGHDHDDGGGGGSGGAG
jgi:hypothetical protein